MPQANEIADLVTTTLRELGRGKWTDNSSAYLDTVALKILMTKNRTMLESGYEIQFNRSTSVGSNARFVTMGAPDIVTIPNVMSTGVVPWRHVTNNWAWEFREPLMNKSPSQIVELIKTRRIASIGDMIELFERAIWRVPAVSDTVTIYGIPYYVVKSNTAVTATNRGFSGTAPTGYTTVAGINPTTDTRWRNYATQYTAITKEDLVRKARQMAKFTGFKPLVESTPEYATGPAGPKREYYANYATIAPMEEMLEAQNENLGTDLAKYDGKTMFRGAPVNYVQELDNDTTNPLYQIDWSVMGIRGLKGAWMKETAVSQVPGQHTMSATHTDCTMNLVCYDRRKQGVLATDTTMPA
jgi:hypothetical protein